jgi:hypothetical protein
MTIPNHIPAIHLKLAPKAKTKNAQAALDMFLADDEFILGLTGDTRITRSHIFTQLRERGVQEALVVIYNHSGGEVLRATLECTYIIKRTIKDK